MINTILKALAKTWKITVPLAIIIAGYFCLQLYVKSLKDDIQFWQNETAKRGEIIQLKETMYEMEVLKVKEVSAFNEILKDRLDEADGKLLQAGNLAFRYKTRLDSIETHPIIDTLVIASDSVQGQYLRAFEKEQEKLFISGWFQTRSPFLLTIDSLVIDFDLDFIFWEDDNGMLKYTMDTKSVYLRPTRVNIQQIKAAERIEFFLGMEANISATELKFRSIEAIGGLKFGSNGYYLKTGFRPWSNIDVGIGVLKFFQF